MGARRRHGTSRLGDLMISYGLLRHVWGQPAKKRTKPVKT
jgi:hypothetical protein